MTRTPKDRIWTIDEDPLVADDQSELSYALAEAAAILRRVGGAITILPDREEIAPEIYQTTRYIFKWSSYAPAKRAEVPEAVEEPVAA